MRSSLVSIILLSTVAAATVVGLSGIPAPGDGAGAAISGTDLPDFTTFTDAAARKSYFIRYLRPIVAAANRRIREDHAHLEPLVDALLQGVDIDPDQWRWMRRLARDYDVPADNRARVAVGLDLLRKVDVIPVSLVLAQAATESAWGTSRFAQQGNNLFGQHCFDPGCGIVPAHRRPGQHHEVQTFATVQASVRSYMHNLNTHPRYKDLRIIRQGLRTRGEPITGLALVRGLKFYSERRQDYIAEVRDLIQDLDLGPHTESP